MAYLKPDQVEYITPPSRRTDSHGLRHDQATLISFREAEIIFCLVELRKYQVKQQLHVVRLCPHFKIY